MAKPAMTVDEYQAQLARESGRVSVTFIPEPEPEPLFCPLISVDDHALEAPDLFETRMPAKFRGSAPSLELVDGISWWVVDDTRTSIMMADAASGRPMEEFGPSGVSLDDMRLGVKDPVARLDDMDIIGVWGSLCFGSTAWGFAGTRFSKMRDKEVGLACLGAYNSWMLEDWCGVAPDRYIPCQLPWLCDAEVAAAEIYRNAERGFRAVSFSENPEDLGFAHIYDRSWDPFFRACEETQTVVNLHVGSSGKVKIPSSVSTPDVSVALFPMSGIETLVDWIYAGIPTRFPAIKIALSEAGVSWVPMILERLTRVARANVGGNWPGGELTPSELVHRNFFFTSIEDPSAFRALDVIGSDNIMVETDYPHFDSTWPTAQAVIREGLAHLPPDVVRKICYENAARLYRATLPPPELIARSEIGLPAATSI